MTVIPPFRSGSRMVLSLGLFLAPAVGLCPQTSSQAGAAVRISRDPLIFDLLRSRPRAFQRILNSVNRYEVQILYIQIDRNRDNMPFFTQYAYRLNSRKYFNPASLIKLPVVCLAFQKLNALNIPGLDKNTRLSIRQDEGCPTGIDRDETALEGYPSIAHLAKKMLIVSDNDAYSQLYEFLGWDQIHQGLFLLGYRNARITRRFCPCGYEKNRITNPTTFFDRKGSVLYHQSTQYSVIDYKNPLTDVFKGKNHLDDSYRLKEGPYDYSTANHLGLQDMTDLLRSVLFPQSVPAERRFFLTGDDYRFLLKMLSILPRESDYPKYRNPRLFPDNMKKYFLYGDWPPDRKIEGTGVRLFNMVGFSDGYISDCAYIVDFEKNIEFFLSAVIYVNANGVVRDGTYEYNTVGLPFLAELGRTVYDYETGRSRRFLPDLSVFQISYP